MTDIFLLPSGIYQIHCIPTGKIYIGSTVNFEYRWGQHRSRLRRGDHVNIHLQSAWIKYGEQSFEFSILERVEVPNLLSVEQEWINRTGCADSKIGFNLYAVAGSPGDSHVQVWEGFTSPDGNEVTITNLFDFCSQNNLEFPSMHRLAMGKSKLKSYKGWTHKNSPRKREYIKTYTGFVDPSGHLVGIIVNLAAFCREHELDKTHMVAVAKGRLYSHRGWTYDNDRQQGQQRKTYTGFINPDGQQTTITNLAGFCREHGLNVVHMHAIKGGRRNSHKGWTWQERKNEDEK